MLNVTTVTTLGTVIYCISVTTSGQTLEISGSKEMTKDIEYRLRFVRQQNGPRRRVQHGNVTLHGVLEKRTPNGRILAETRLGSIDIEALEYDLVRDRDEFWRVTDLYLNLFDVPPEAADEVCEYLSQIVRPITEREAASYYGRSDQLRETITPTRKKI
ncbi:MAG: hypothetical protein ACXW1R_06625 [Halobacteriota archaeon]